MPAPDSQSTEGRLVDELAALPDTARTRVVLGALALATNDVRRRRGPSSDAIAAMAATVVAFVSLILAVDQTRTQRKQLAAAVWPSVRVRYSNAENPDHPEYYLSLTNGGVGPARIQSFSIRWRGKPVTDVSEWSKAACPTLSAEWLYGTQTGTLLSPGGQAMIARRPRETRREDDRCVQEVMIEPAEFSICYCSALDDCWNVSRGDEPVAVHDCVAASRQPQFEHGN